MTLTVTDLTIARGGMCRFCQGLSFDVADPGQALVLRGPNGIGEDDAFAHVGGVAASPCRPDRSKAPQIRARYAYAGHSDGLKSNVEQWRRTLSFWSRGFWFSAGDP